MNPWVVIALRRSAQALAVALIVGTLCFVMMRLLPGDLATRVAAGRYGYDLVGNAAADAVRAELGLDRPAWQALMLWWGDILRMDLGVSMVSGEPVSEELAHQLSATVHLSLVAILLALAVGVPAGVMAGLRPGGVWDRLTLAGAVVLRALPTFLVALLLMLALAVQLGALPVAGDGHAASVLLPATTLALALAAGLARITRDTLVALQRSPDWFFALSKGLSPGQVLWRHGARRLALPATAYLGVHAALLIEGAVVVETLFAWPGIGHALVHAVFGRDVPVIQGAALTMGLLFVLLSAAVDALCLTLDPRRRLAQTGGHHG
ncbi:MAG: ABC transporter permease [Aquabacterium sp.]